MKGQMNSLHILLSKNLENFPMILRFFQADILEVKVHLFANTSGKTSNTIQSSVYIEIETFI